MNITVEMLDTALEQARQTSQARAWDTNVEPEMVEVMRLVHESKRVRGLANSAMVLSALHIMSKPKADTKELAEEIMDTCPLKYSMAEMFLAGFLFGKRVEEVKKLEELASH